MRFLPPKKVQWRKSEQLITPLHYKIIMLIKYSEDLGKSDMTSYGRKFSFAFINDKDTYARLSLIPKWIPL